MLSNDFDRKMWHITNVLQTIGYKNGRYITSQGELLKSGSLIRIENLGYRDPRGH